MNLVHEWLIDQRLPYSLFFRVARRPTIALFTKTNSDGHVWFNDLQVEFYDLQADGFSLDDRRTPLLPGAKVGAVPAETLTNEAHAKNSLPDALARWAERNGSELHPPRF